MAMPGENGAISLSMLRQKSLETGGFGAAERRRYWLQLLDLQHLEAQLEASTSRKTINGHLSTSDRTSSLPLSSPASSPEVPLDGDGWQIPHPSYLEEEGGDVDGDAGWDDDEWNVASSKRQRRRKRAAANTAGENASMQRTSSMAGTIGSAASTSATTNGQEHDTNTTNSVESTPHIDGGGADKESLKEERRKRRREKKRTKAKGGSRDEETDTNGIIDIEASGILLPSSNTVEEEQNETLKSDWVKTDRVKNITHRDEPQVALDINRSFLTLAAGRQRQIRRAQLSHVINTVLRRHPPLNYYQGYHDVVSVILFVLIPEACELEDEEKSLQVVCDVTSRISLHLLRDNMTATMEPTMGHLKVMRNLLRDIDYTLSVEVESASALPYFALPWLISLFAHEVKEQLSAVLFDYILARGPASILYVALSLILKSRSDTDQSAGLEQDAAEMHHSLSQLPSQIQIDSLPKMLAQADELTERYPLESVLTRTMGPRSVLSTWKQLPLISATSPSENAPEVPTPWAHADALAEAILSGSTDNIVIDALPTPPASEDDDFNEKEKRKQRKQGRKTASLFAIAGAVGTVGLAALLMYGAGKSGLSFS